MERRKKRLQEERKSRKEGGGCTSEKREVRGNQVWQDGEDVFLQYEASLVITLKESVYNLCRGVSVVRVIAVMEVSFPLRSLDGPSPFNFIELQVPASRHEPHF